MKEPLIRKQKLFYIPELEESQFKTVNYSEIDLQIQSKPIKSPPWALCITEKLEVRFSVRAEANI